MYFTPAQLSNLVSSHNSGDIQGYCLKIPTEIYKKRCGSGDQNKQLFQVLLVDVDGSGKSTTKLVYGQKENLQQQYGIQDLPSDGVKVESGFVDFDSIRSKYSTVRFLLQCRKLSQMMVKTWVEESEVPDEEKEEVKLIREIFHTYNILPDTYFLDDEGAISEIKSPALKIKIWQAAREKQEYVSDLIKPDSAGYTSIRLVLLLCGQAYYKTASMGEYCKIGCNIQGLENGIFSTYEMVWEYGIDVSWDSFYATRIDISQSGLAPNPPYTMVTLGYPPRPEEFNVTQTEIKKWAFADDSSGDFPFYPEVSSSDWKDTQIKYVVPPYPYLPLSCT